MTLAERQALRRREVKAWTDAGKHIGPKPRRAAWKGESAMSVREVDGRRQIDTWIIEPAEDGWAVSVNGEVVGRAGSLKEAKEVAQAEATAVAYGSPVRRLPRRTPPGGSGGSGASIDCRRGRVTTVKEGDPTAP